ncbi:hypothetical protein Taro_010628 [Colocasia esculenta]|uniref:Transcription factor MYC/MYB N-terminal domain-containing protein n=1 Tax=Colocasia esculenta TaxID=4460 RepID=A0A843U3M3_COLES|nr:hypothetical protein [Colocasia esculenta]
MEEQLSPLAVAHLLQHTLRSLCTHEDSQWDLQGGAFDRSRGNRRNWILVWEDGFCNFAASASGCAGSSSSTGYGGCVDSLHIKGLQPELFFKMSHEIYSYGEGLIGKVAADRSHKWVFKEAPDNDDANFLSAWHNSTDSVSAGEEDLYVYTYIYSILEESAIFLIRVDLIVLLLSSLCDPRSTDNSQQPRTWEAQFQCGIQTIALIAVREGVVQLGAVNKVMEDLSYVVLLRKRFSYLESIPGVLLPHPSSTAFPFKVDGCYALGSTAEDFHSAAAAPTLQPTDLFGHSHLLSQQVRVTPSMSSLEALLSKLPPVGPLPPPSLLPPADFLEAAVNLGPAPQRPGEVMGLDRMGAKEEMDDKYCSGSSERSMELGGQGGGAMSAWYIHAANPTDGLI